MQNIMEVTDAYTAFDRDQITLLNQTASPLLRLPPELRIKIYVFAFSTATLQRRSSCPPDKKCHLEERNHCLRFENASKGLPQTCRQLRQEATDNLKLHLKILLLPSYITLYALVRNLGHRNCASLETIEIHEKMAKRLRGLNFGNYRGYHVDLWKDGNIGRRTFPSLRYVMVKGVWRGNVQKTKSAIRSSFGNEDLLIGFS
ncbi:hypothetical protein M3J09_010169 [Ascochyta lentis]